MPSDIISVRDFSFAFGKKAILKNITLAAPEGAYLSVIGPNGAGKTTLLKCVNRILAGGTGEIVVAGRPLREYSQRELARVLSYVPQAEGRSAPFTVREFVTMGRYPYFTPFSSVRARDREAVAEALDITGTTAFADRPLATLSGGERQRVFIAAAVAQAGRVMLLDEPTTFLDPKHQVEIHALLRRLHRERGVTIVSVTHDVTAAVLYSDLILALKNGAVAFIGPASEILAPGRLEGIYEVAFHRAANPAGGQPFVFPAGPA